MGEPWKEQLRLLRDDFLAHARTDLRIVLTMAILDPRSYGYALEYAAFHHAEGDFPDPWPLQNPPDMEWSEGIKLFGMSFTEGSFNNTDTRMFRRAYFGRGGDKAVTKFDDLARRAGGWAKAAPEMPVRSKYPDWDWVRLIFWLAERHAPGIIRRVGDSLGLLMPFTRGPLTLASVDNVFRMSVWAIDHICEPSVGSEPIGVGSNIPEDNPPLSLPTPKNRLLQLSAAAPAPPPANPSAPPLGGSSDDWIVSTKSTLHKALGRGCPKNASLLKRLAGRNELDYREIDNGPGRRKSYAIRLHDPVRHEEVKKNACDIDRAK